jgi:hypothetical protein
MEPSVDPPRGEAIRPGPMPRSLRYAVSALAIAIKVGERDTKEVADERPPNRRADTYTPHGF